MREPFRMDVFIPLRLGVLHTDIHVKDIATYRLNWPSG